MAYLVKKEESAHSSIQNHVINLLNMERIVNLDATMEKNVNFFIQKCVLILCSP